MNRAAILSLKTEGAESRSNNLCYKDLRRWQTGCKGDHRSAAAGNESGGELFVAMMQAADLPDSDDSSDPAWLDGARVRAILVEYKMRPRSANLSIH